MRAVRCGLPTPHRTSPQLLSAGLAASAACDRERTGSAGKECYPPDACILSPARSSEFAAWRGRLRWIRLSRIRLSRLRLRRSLLLVNVGERSLSFTSASRDHGASTWFFKQQVERERIRDHAVPC